MIGVPLLDSSMLIGENMSVIVNTTMSSSVLKKKANAISYHKIRESVACKILKFVFVNSEKNHGDVFTKVLDKPKFTPLVEPYYLGNHDTLLFLGKQLRRRIRCYL